MAIILGGIMKGDFGINEKTCTSLVNAQIRFVLVWLSLMYDFLRLPWWWLHNKGSQPRNFCVSILKRSLVIILRSNFCKASSLKKNSPLPSSNTIPWIMSIIVFGLLFLVTRPYSEEREEKCHFPFGHVLACNCRLNNSLCAAKRKNTNLELYPS